MRRKREPGTRNPLSWPLSKQRMMVCWLTLQILAASPVVKTVFMGTSTPSPTRQAGFVRFANDSPQAISEPQIVLDVSRPEADVASFRPPRPFRGNVRLG